MRLLISRFVNFSAVKCIKSEVKLRINLYQSGLFGTGDEDPDIYENL